MTTNPSKFTTSQIFHSTLEFTIRQCTTLMYIKPKEYFRIKWILHNEQIDSIQPYASVVDYSIDIKTGKFCEKFIFNLVQISIRQ